MNLKKEKNKIVSECLMNEKKIEKKSKNAEKHLKFYLGGRILC